MERDLFAFPTTCVCVCLCASVKFAQTGAMRGLNECCEGMERGKGRLELVPLLTIKVCWT
jgi:hypothetical protein